MQAIDAGELRRSVRRANAARAGVTSPSLQATSEAQSHDSSDDEEEEVRLDKKKKS